MEFLHDAQIWVTISFVVFSVLAFRYGRQAFLNILDGRIEEIRKEIETAESLRVEAQELLAQYQRKQRDSKKEAQAIVDSAKKHAEKIRKDAEDSLKELMNRREQQLQDRLHRMEEKTLQEIRTHAAQLAVQATREIIIEKMDDKTNSRLIDDSIKNVANSL